MAKVRFLKYDMHGPYRMRPGMVLDDIPDEQAERFVRRGTAELVKVGRPPKFSPKKETRNVRRRWS